MTRQIKFRAKRIDNGAWVYGSYIHYVIEGFEDVPQYRIFLENPGKGKGHRIDIDKNTVGQFTGMYDNDGKEIYEGDICVFGSLDDDDFGYCPFEVADDNPAYEVKWFDGRYIIRSHLDIADEFCDNLCGVGPGSVGVTADGVRNHFKVIGNVYDNPGLIKRNDEQNV